jgi:hypothetical protein
VLPRLVHQELVKTYKIPNLKISIIPQDAFSKNHWFYLVVQILPVLLEQRHFL